MLNAFRHQRNRRSPGTSNLPAVDRCSTPFGINGIVALNSLPSLLDPECSTPFGINGIVAPRTLSRASEAGMCSTPFGINGIVAWSRRFISAARIGAQRLSASTESSLLYSSDELISVVVLNAFRHQRNRREYLRENLPEEVTCSTPFGINGIVAITLAKAPVNEVVCSTPFGINGIVAFVEQFGLVNVRVLNAFRHQRNRRKRPA